MQGRWKRLQLVFVSNNILFLFLLHTPIFLYTYICTYMYIYKSNEVHIHSKYIEIYIFNY